ncbi:MAG: hypothetical protein IKK63_05560 [Clostridia bacterium]|nr:hypothetical protein [Clostridia bacterium]
MRKIINKKMYNTETAKRIASCNNGLGYNDINYFSERLYRKKNREFFLYGEGGPATKYSECIGQNSWSSGCDIIPLTLDEAKEWAEEHMSADYFVEVFGEVEE